MTSLTLLGSTGSIGTSTLDVVRRWPDRFAIYALVAGPERTTLLAQQIAEFRPKVAVVADENAPRRAAANIEIKRDSGARSRRRRPQRVLPLRRPPKPSIVMSAIVGVEGLEATYEAVRLAKRVGLANKEVLVASGKLVIDAMRDVGSRADSRRQRAQRGAPVPARRTPERGCEADPNGLGRPVPRDAGRRTGSGDSASRL